MKTVQEIKKELEESRERLRQARRDQDWGAADYFDPYTEALEWVLDEEVTKDENGSGNQGDD